jgi:hypothetical protein
MKPQPLALALLLSVAYPAPAPGEPGIPCAATSTVPASVVACPGGDVDFHVVLRDCEGWPCPSASVTLRYGPCTGLHLCPHFCSTCGCYCNDAYHWITMEADAQGVVHWDLRLGGTCPGTTILVLGDTFVALGYVTVASPDQDGDLAVTNADALRVRSLLGTHEASADFDGDGTVTNADLLWVTAWHAGHSCAVVVPAGSRTWGELKLRYR